MAKIRNADTNREKFWAAVRFLLAEAVNANCVPDITDKLIELAKELNRKDRDRL